MESRVKILGIETSCDDTSVALLDSELGVLENLISSQIDLHNHFGGVVPELASRAHLVNLLPLIDMLCDRQAMTLDDLDGVAVTAGPGLIGALLVGLSTAKAICFTKGLPLAGVHHIEGHILANQLSAPMVLPAAVLVVSGGHTEVVLMLEVGVYERLGWTLDDAAGEAFDKSAQLLGLPYPGGPVIDRLAVRGTPGRFNFPRPPSEGPANHLQFQRPENGCAVAGRGAGRIARGSGRCRYLSGHARGRGRQPDRQAVSGSQGTCSQSGLSGRRCSSQLSAAGADRRAGFAGWISFSGAGIGLLHGQRRDDRRRRYGKIAGGPVRPPDS